MGVAEDIAHLELELRELIIKYEQYFFGIEKREPLKLLDKVDRLAKRYQNVSIPNSMQRFKYDSLVASLSVHKQKWARINRLIEEGKYQRDHFRMTLRQQQGGQKAPASPKRGDEMERIYQQYLAARKACNLPVEKISRDRIEQAIERQTPMIQEKYNCRDIDFVVVIEDGKPRLKARPKSSCR
jgi:hypothetical protein